MSDETQIEIKTRNDFQQEPPKASLPPTQKLAKVVWDDWFLLIVLGIALVATKWEILPKEDFGRAMFGILLIKATLSQGKGLNLDALPFLRK